MRYLSVPSGQGLALPYQGFPTAVDRCVVRHWLLFFRLSRLLKKVLFDFSSQFSPDLIVCVGVEVGDHSRLGVASVSLDCIDVPSADLELDRRAAMP